MLHTEFSTALRARFRAHYLYTEERDALRTIHTVAATRGWGKTSALDKLAHTTTGPSAYTKIDAETALQLARDFSTVRDWCDLPDITRENLTACAVATQVLQRFSHAFNGVGSANFGSGLVTLGLNALAEQTPTSKSKHRIPRWMWDHMANFAAAKVYLATAPTVEAGTVNSINWFVPTGERGYNVSVREYSSASRQNPPAIILEEPENAAQRTPIGALYQRALQHGIREFFTTQLGANIHWQPNLMGYASSLATRLGIDWATLDMKRGHITSAVHGRPIHINLAAAQVFAGRYMDHADTCNIFLPGEGGDIRAAKQFSAGMLPALFELTMTGLARDYSPHHIDIGVGSWHPEFFCTTRPPLTFTLRDAENHATAVWYERPST